MILSVKTALIKLSLVFSFTLLLSFGLAGEAKANPCAKHQDPVHYTNCMRLYGAGDGYVIEEKKRIEDTLERGAVRGDASAEYLGDHLINVSQHYLIRGVWGPSEDGMTDEEASLRRSILGQGAVPTMNGLIAYMYQKPVSTQTYLADLFRSARLVPEAQAQGLGFASLNPVLEVWKVFRNLAYLVFVVIFIVIGFMIMLRHKVGGQAAITAQQAIPNIIVAMLFVTFSYAIGALLIDLMYVFMYLIIGLFGGDRGLINQNIFQVGASLVWRGMRDGWSTSSQAIQNIIDFGGIEKVLGWIGGLTVAVIFSLAILFAVFKLFFELLKSYISIILLITFSPLILMAGALPGKNTFGNWLRNLVGNLAIFPIVLILLIMQEIMANANMTGGGFMPPYLLGTGQAEVVVALIGLGILLAIPEVAKKAKEALGAKEGVFGELARATAANTKRAFPASSRMLALGAGGAAGLAGGTRNAWRELGRPGSDLGSVSRNFGHGFRDWGSNALGGFDVEKNIPLLGKRKISIPGTVRAAGAAQRAMGANNPDLLNLLTNPIDDKWDEESKMSRHWQQLFEDHENSVRDRTEAELRRKR